MKRGVVVAVGFKVEGDANEWLTSIKATGGQGHGPHPDHRLDRSPLHG